MVCYVAKQHLEWTGKCQSNYSIRNAGADTPFYEGTGIRLIRITFFPVRYDTPECGRAFRG